MKSYATRQHFGPAALIDGAVLANFEDSEPPSKFICKNLLTISA